MPTILFAMRLKIDGHTYRRNRVCLCYLQLNVEFLRRHSQVPRLILFKYKTIVLNFFYVWYTLKKKKTSITTRYRTNVVTKLNDFIAFFTCTR